MPICILVPILLFVITTSIILPPPEGGQYSTLESLIGIIPLLLVLPLLFAMYFARGTTVEAILSNDKFVFKRPSKFEFPLDDIVGIISEIDGYALVLNHDNLKPTDYRPPLGKILATEGLGYQYMPNAFRGRGKEQGKKKTLIDEAFDHLIAKLNFTKHELSILDEQWIVYLQDESAQKIINLLSNANTAEYSDQWVLE